MTDRLNRLAEKIADKIGSPLSILLHTVAFAAILSLMFFWDVDRVLLILTTAISVEAIYLGLLTQLVVTNEKKKNA